MYMRTQAYTLPETVIGRALGVCPRALVASAARSNDDMVARTCVPIRSEDSQVHTAHTILLTSPSVPCQRSTDVTYGIDYTSAITVTYSP
jgi:hypothetical protein